MPAQVAEKFPGPGGTGTGTGGAQGGQRILGEKPVLRIRGGAGTAWPRRCGCASAKVPQPGGGLKARGSAVVWSGACVPLGLGREEPAKTQRAALLRACEAAG